MCHRPQRFLDDRILNTGIVHIREDRKLATGTREKITTLELNFDIMTATLYPVQTRLPNDFETVFFSDADHASCH